MRIAVRGWIVPRESEMRRRGENRGKRRKKEQEKPAKVETAKESLLSETQEIEAKRILGERPWYSLVFDCETVVSSATDVLGNGQPLRVGYYELRGMGVKEVKRRLERGTLKPEDRHQVREAGFILPDENECIVTHDGRRLPIYAGFDLAAAREAVEDYAALHSYRWPSDRMDKYGRIHVRSKQDFIHNVLYRYGYGRGKYIIGANVVGHNLFYDITRLITDVWREDGTLIRGVRQGGPDFRQGFSLKLCDCPHEDCFAHPRIRASKLGRFKMRYRFGAVHYKEMKRTYRGRFIDTAPLGLALRKSRGASLETMGETFKAKVRKFEEHPDFAGPITEEYLDYLVNDVRGTYWLLDAELEDFYALGLPLHPQSVYSTASLAKALLRKFGFPDTRNRTWKTPDEIMGKAAATYYGGRSEVGYRGVPAEVMHLDFKSQYGAIKHNMDTQLFDLAVDVHVEDCAQELREWFASRTPAQMLDEGRDPTSWRTLATIVLVKPDGKLLLPVRADFGGGTRNIAQCYVTSEAPLPYTLADIIAGYLRGEGSQPNIVEAVRFVPIGQVPTQPVEIFGRVIDPVKVAVWTKVLDVRREIKTAAGAAAGDEADRLSAQQNALKEMALAGSYGILEELNDKVYDGRLLTLDVYALGRTKRLGNVIEKPGPYFAGALGTFIPAGGRLLLAIAEKLAADRGLSYVFMDTDSIILRRPDGMTREEFRRLVQENVDYFVPLNPYAEGGSLLAYEPQNYRIDEDDPNKTTTEFEPLYCVATSAKRYVEYNLNSDGAPVIRKFTSHGLGTWGRREKDDVPGDVPPPHTYKIKKGMRVPDSSALGGPMWIYRQQYLMVEARLKGHYRNGEPLATLKGHPIYVPRFEETLDDMAMYSYNLETWADYERMRRPDGIRPGGFITVYPAHEDAVLRNIHAGPIEVTKEMLDKKSREKKEIDGPQETIEPAGMLTSSSKAMYSPFAGSVGEALSHLSRGDVRRIADDAVVTDSDSIKSMYHVIRGYFTHPEQKAANGRETGEMRPREIDVRGVDVVGHDSHKLAQAAAIDTNGTLGMRFDELSYGDTKSAEQPRRIAPIEDVQPMQLSSLFGEDKADILAASCLSLPTINAVLKSECDASPQTRAALAFAMQLLQPDKPQSIAGWREELDVTALADVLGIGEQEAEARIKGRATWTAEQRERLIQFMADLRSQRSAAAEPKEWCVS